MTHTMRSSPVRTVAAVAALGFVLAACGSADGDPTDRSADDTTTTDAPAGADEHDHDDADTTADTGEEVSEPDVRLVVTTHDGTEFGAAVLDADTGAELISVDTAARTVPTVIGDGRHVLLTQSDAGVTQVLDAGSWAEGHGDHFHYYVADPALLDVAVEGDTPIHVVPHDDATAIFHDGEGTATVVADDELGHAADHGHDPDSVVVDSGAPHHGVVVPLGEQHLVSIPGPTSEDLPVGVRLVDDEGAELARHEACPELHGETTIGRHVLFACADRILAVDADDATAAATAITYPATDGGRVGSFLPGTDDGLAVGNFTETSLLAVDPEAATVTEVDAGGTYAAQSRGAHGEIVVLTTDGTLRVIDPRSGAVDGEVADVVAPFEIPEDWTEPRPTLTVAGHTAYVADSATSTVVPVELESFQRGDPLPVPGVPSGIVAVGEGHGH